MSDTRLLEMITHTGDPSVMGLNGNRFKLGAGRKPCPGCLGCPPLKLANRRMMAQCETRGGIGSVAKESVEH